MVDAIFQETETETILQETEGENFPKPVKDIKPNIWKDV